MNINQAHAQVEVAQDLLRQAAVEPNAFKRALQLEMATLAMDKVKQYVGERVYETHIYPTFNFIPSDKSVQEMQNAIKTMVGKSLIDSGHAYQ